MPEVMIITEGFNPTRGTEIYEPRKRRERESRRQTRKERGPSLRKREDAGMEKTGCGGGEQKTMI